MFSKTSLITSIVFIAAFLLVQPANAARDLCQYCGTRQSCHVLSPQFHAPISATIPLHMFHQYDEEKTFGYWHERGQKYIYEAQVSLWGSSDREVRVTLTNSKLKRTDPGGHPRSDQHILYGVRAGGEEYFYHLHGNDRECNIFYDRWRMDQIYGVSVTQIYDQPLETSLQAKLEAQQMFESGMF